MHVLNPFLSYLPFSSCLLPLHIFPVDWISHQHAHILFFSHIKNNPLLSRLAPPAISHFFFIVSLYSKAFQQSYLHTLLLFSLFWFSIKLVPMNF